MENHSPNTLVWVSIGGNRGRVHATFDRVIQHLQSIAKTPIIESPRYWSDPWGETEQPRFLNQVVGFQTKSDPPSFMEQLHVLEAEHGRNRSLETRWGPRSIDLDLLCWPEQSGLFGTLQLPHPRLHLRRFVLQPWSDVAPQVIPYGLSDTVETLLQRCTDTGFIERC